MPYLLTYYLFVMLCFLCGHVSIITCQTYGTYNFYVLYINIIFNIFSPNSMEKWTRVKPKSLNLVNGMSQKLSLIFLRWKSELRIDLTPTFP